MGLLIVFSAIIVVLVASQVIYLAGHGLTPADFWRILSSRQVLSGIRLSLITSLTTLVLVLLFAVPAGYALSRYRSFDRVAGALILVPIFAIPIGCALAPYTLVTFVGWRLVPTIMLAAILAFPIAYALSRYRLARSLVETLVDVPIVMPPVVIGLSLLAFFGTGAGAAIKAGLATAGWSLTGAIGIVLCQFLLSISYCIRAMKASFDGVDERLEHVAMSLGASRWQACRRVALPLARSGLVAGAVMTWARAIGAFGPLMVFVGTGPRVQVMPTAMWLELNVGNIETSFAIALVALAMAGVALAAVHWLVPGRKWT